MIALRPIDVVRPIGRKPWLSAGLVALVAAGCGPQGDPATVQTAPPANPVRNVTAGPEPGGSVRGSYLAGRLARAERDVAIAAEYFSYALTHDPDNSNLQRRTFRLLVADGRVGEARVLARRILEESPADDMSNLVLALDAFRAKDHAGARDILGRARGTASCGCWLPR